MLFVHITTQIKGEKYGDLLSEKGGNGFPYLVFMDKDGTVLVEHQGPRTVDAFEETGKKAVESLELHKKADAGDKDAKVKVVIADLEAGHIKAAEAKKKLEGIELTADQKKAFEQGLANGEIRDIVDSYHPTDQASANKAREEIAQKFLERKKAGKPAPTGEREVQMYWMLLMGHAEKVKDAALYEEGYNALEKRFADNPQAKNALAHMKKTLETLKKGDSKPDEKKPGGE